MKQVKCKSGLTGWQDRLRNVYANFEEFESNSEIYGVATRLGYETDADGMAEEKAWNANPIIQGSVEPSDCRIVLDENKKTEFIRPEVEEIIAKFLNKEITKEQLVKKLRGFDNYLKKLFGKKGSQSIWFRTFKGDTMVTTVNDIESTLNLPENHGNYKCLIESLQIGVNETGMVVYYS